MKLILLLSFVFFLSCTRHDQIVDIRTVVLDEESDFDINDVVSYKFIPLETREDCLIGSVRKITIVDDKIYIDSEGDKLLVFDISGKFITQIGRKGNGPGEYRSICNFHIDKEKQIITISDGGQSRLIQYELNNYDHISTKRIFYFSDCCWLSDGNIAWFFWGGYEDEKKDRYFIKITDSKLNELNYLYSLDIEPQCPITSGSLFYSLNQKSYFNLPYISTIYEITSQNIIPTYQLDLGYQKFAPTEWIQKESTQNLSVIVYTDYISAQNVKETSDYISVGYCAKGANAYIGFYNKKTEKSCKYTLPDFITHTGLEGAGIVLDTYEDNFLLTLNTSVLKRNPNTKITELKSIINNIDEEDNPVICLLKLK